MSKHFINRRAINSRSIGIHAKRCVVVFAALLLQACAALTPPATRPMAASSDAVLEAMGNAGTPQQSVIAPATNVPSAAAKLFAQATHALEANNLPDATATLQKLTGAYPQYASPFTDLGIVYARSGQEKAALAALARAIEMQPGDCRAQVQTGILLRHRHQFSAAEAAYKACLAHNPDYPPALLNLGILDEIYMGKWHDALASYQHYQAMQPSPDKRIARWIAALSRQLDHGNDSIAQSGSLK